MPFSLSLSANNCLRPADTRDVPFSSSDAYPSLPNATQVIITSYKFHCKGDITAWYLHIPENGRNYTIRLQVWKPSQTVSSDGCYNLVGQNSFYDITAESGPIVTLEPSDVITVFPGNVVGYYVYYTQSNSEDPNIESVIKLNVNYSEESVWYHTNTKEDPLFTSGSPDTCLFAVGTEPDRAIKSFTNAAPILSLNMSKSNHCDLEKETYLKCRYSH